MVLKPLEVASRSDRNFCNVVRAICPENDHNLIGVVGMRIKTNWHHRLDARW